MDYRIERASRRCSLCGRGLPDNRGDWFSALKEADDGFFSRSDFCGDCFGSSEKGEFFSFWKRKVRKRSAKLFFDEEGAIHLFRQLIGKPEYAELVYVLSLLLMRRRVLELVGIAEQENRKYIVIKERDGNVYRLADVPLNSEKEKELNERLLQLFEQV